MAKAERSIKGLLIEEEKWRIIYSKGKRTCHSTFTLSTANTPPQSTGNTPTDSDDDIPKDETKQNYTSKITNQPVCCFLSQGGTQKVLIKALADESGLKRWQEELLQFKLLQRYWFYVNLPEGKRVASFVYQLDVKSASIVATITEEVYVQTQPPGFEKILLIQTRSTELSRHFMACIKPQEHDFQVTQPQRTLLLHLEAFSSSDLCWDNHDRRSTSGWNINNLGEDWSLGNAKKQQLWLYLLYRSQNICNTAQFLCSVQGTAIPSIVLRSPHDSECSVPGKLKTQEANPFNNKLNKYTSSKPLKKPVQIDQPRPRGLSNSWSRYKSNNHVSTAQLKSLTDPTQIKGKAEWDASKKKEERYPQMKWNCMTKVQSSILKTLSMTIIQWIQRKKRRCYEGKNAKSDSIRKRKADNMLKKRPSKIFLGVAYTRDKDSYDHNAGLKEDIQLIKRVEDKDAEHGHGIFSFQTTPNQIGVQDTAQIDRSLKAIQKGKTTSLKVKTADAETKERPTIKNPEVSKAK
ncbi:hypothetical protein Tco_1386542 [Tanacetum coccineum]